LPVDEPNADGRTALHVAASQSDCASVVALLGAGAAVNTQDHAGNIPLHLAFSDYERRPDVEFPVFHALVAAGADRSIRNREGRTPYDLAVGEAYPEEYLRLLAPARRSSSAIPGATRTGTSAPACRSTPSATCSWRFARRCQVPVSSAVFLRAALAVVAATRAPGRTRLRHRRPGRRYPDRSRSTILLPALILQYLYGIRSERLLMEQLDYNLLFRWFVGLNADDPVWVPTVFTKNRDRLLEGNIAQRFLEQVVAQAKAKKLTSDEHFSADGTLQGAKERDARIQD
jgi:hypothetical protein